MFSQVFSTPKRLLGPRGHVGPAQLSPSSAPSPTSSLCPKVQYSFAAREWSQSHKQQHLPWHNEVRTEFWLSDSGFKFWLFSLPIASWGYVRTPAWASVFSSKMGTYQLPLGDHMYTVQHPTRNRITIKDIIAKALVPPIVQETKMTRWGGHKKSGRFP